MASIGVLKEEWTVNILMCNICKKKKKKKIFENRKPY